ncbi:hypothetical protein [Paracoccus sp. J56]|uniref:hypothetical protein n=1 Tax=Paracoccus sp. J56 TaxID=935850 RepID=UPI000A0EA564|nr:hypothetical protein [Paracoccus sp. J56]SMG28149.1 hypothetical protein SAMN02746000_01594 [Paracoccus sp. J56]
MAAEKDDACKWFTAGEAAKLAEIHQVLGVPATRWGMPKQLKGDDGAGPPSELCRKREGQRGGGALEYHWTAFD